MNYSDDEARHQFHQAGTLLQIVCSILEFECAKYGGQLEMIGCENGIAVVRVSDVPHQGITQACEEVNKQFRRFDEAYTCKLTDMNLGFVECFATDHKDLKELN